jgi:4'-phosphopantetheinyl transferase
MAAHLESKPPPLLLGDGEAHLWFADPEEIGDPALLSQYVDLLSEEERAQYQRYRFEKDRRLHLVSHALARVALSRYAPVRPEEWTFAHNAHGKPRVAGPRVGRALRFNLAHTRGMVMCGVVREAEIGVDVEDMERKSDTQGIARRFFSAPERSALEALPEGERRDRFFSLWTLKEAYVKARGMGLSIPLNQFAFHFGEDGAVAAAFDERLGDSADGWGFGVLSPSPERRAAIAVRILNQGVVRVHVRRTVPLIREEALPCRLLCRSERLAGGGV